MELKHPTEDEMREMIGEIMKDVVKAAYGEISDRDEAFFTAGFRLGISSFLRREAMLQLFPEGTKAN